MPTVRTTDINGYVEILDNPITRAGVFDYLGSKIPNVKDLGMDPDKLYPVLRPAEELSRPECLESFKLLPWIDDHLMLGENEELGLTPAEEKGVGGVTGERVYWDDKTAEMKSNLKLFSSTHQRALDNGKIELSLGYLSRFEYAPGEYNGQHYDFIQRDIVGNHLASVDDGRVGVAVLDSADRLTFTFDAKDFTMPIDEAAAGEGGDKKEPTIADIMVVIKALEPLMPFIQKLAAAGAADAVADPAAEEVAAVADADPAADPEKDKKAPVAVVADEAADEKKAAAVMDAAEQRVIHSIGRRNKLAERLSVHVGTFDHSAMTERELVKYGVTKLGITVPAGVDPAAMVEGWLQGRPDPATQATTRTAVQDSADASANPFAKQLAAATAAK